MQITTVKDNLDNLAIELAKNPDDYDIWKDIALAEDAREIHKHPRVYTHKNGKPRITMLRKLQKEAPKDRPKVFRVGQEVTFTYGLKQKVIYTGTIIRKNTDPKEYYIKVEGYPATIILSHRELLVKEV